MKQITFKTRAVAPDGEMLVGVNQVREAMLVLIDQIDILEQSQIKRKARIAQLTALLLQEEES
jgi:hypothetical protein